MSIKRIYSVLALISLSLFIATQALAAVPWAKFSYFQNFSGLNDQLSGTEIQDNEATDIQNVVFDTGGAIKKRFGYLTVPNTPPTKVSTGSVVVLTGLSFFQKNNGNKYVLAITNNDNKATAMYKGYDIGGGLEAGAWKNIDAVILPSSYSNNNFVDFAIAQDEIVFTVPVTTQVKPFAWTGSGNVTYLTADANCPTSTLVKYHKNQLFLSGNSTFPSRVYFSNLDDITKYTATDFFDVQTNDGTKVTGMVSAFDSLYIFKDRAIWRLSGTNRDDFVLSKMVEGIGTLSNSSIKVVNNLIYFTTAQNDIAVYDGGYNVQFISQKIRNTIGGLNFSRATNTLGIAFSTYKYQDQDYYCSMSNAGASTNNNILLFDTAYKAWTKFSGINANAWCVAWDNVGQNILLFGDYNGYVHSYPSTSYYDGNVATSAINAFYQTKWFKYSELALGDKYWRLLKTYCLSENTTNDIFLSAECRSDYEASGRVVNINLSQSGSKWDVAIWDVDTWGGQSLIVGRNEIEKGKNMFQIKFSNMNVNEGFTIFGFENFIESTDRI